jgi:prepilin-type N-terminal cleavage/methylation domain-containing protein
MSAGMNNVRRLMVFGERRSARRDEGFTVIELMVALAIFSIFLTVVLASIISSTKASTNVQVTSQSSSAELSAFQRLDREIRYSDSINFPGVGSGGDPYIEFRTPSTSVSSGVTLCTQWRYDIPTRSLQHRFWNDGTTPLPNWQTDLTNMPNDGGATYPFQLIPASNATSGSTMQQLVLTLDTGNVAIKGAAITTTFVARNSSNSSPSNSDNISPGVSDSPICTNGTRQ